MKNDETLITKIMKRNESDKKITALGFKSNIPDYLLKLNINNSNSLLASINKISSNLYVSIPNSTKVKEKKYFEDYHKELLKNMVLTQNYFSAKVRFFF